MLPSVVNLQRKVKLDTALLQRFVAELVSGVGEAQNRPFSVALVSDRRMTELNHFFRNKKATTDVLSFPNDAEAFESENEDNLGDVVISVEQAKRQAAENKLTLENEIKQLMLHGLLHLCNYDHETDNGEMNSRELELRERLGI
jgi:probable rRNA maturation factor